MAELFENFEVNRAPRWPRLARLTGASAMLHALFFAAILYVPILRDAFHIADRFSDVEYVDEEYERIKIKDVVMLGQGERLQYPPGYFDDQVPGPEAVAQPTPEPTPVPTPSPTPTPTPTPTPSPSPTPSPAPGGDAGATANANGSATDAKAENDLDKVAEQNNVRRPRTVNKRPFLDLLVKYKEMKDRGELNLDGLVEMTIEADRNPDGTLRNVRINRKSGDPKLQEAAESFIQALSASGVLDFLEGTEHLVLTIKLDGSEMTFTAASEMASAAEAKQKALGYNALLVGGAFLKKGRDEATIMSNTKVTSSGKQLVVSFNLPRSAITEMIKKQIPAT
ncbi:MAG TPA: hypothetical protein VD861_00845 [Pyrinomonadaceae bacterium]|nr:hypothetical protein [Pyrinomonadaceae bacterium]